MNGENILDDAKRRIKIEQSVRDFLHIMDTHQLQLEEGLIAWNMLGFTIFQERYPEDTHAETQQRMLAFSQQLFESSR
jgi:hypothetical protein